MVCLPGASVVLALFFGHIAVKTVDATAVFPQIVARAASPVSLKITTTKPGLRNKTAPLLHGLFFEDINVGSTRLTLPTIPVMVDSVQSFRNRALQGKIRAVVTDWKAVGATKISLDTQNPLSDVLMNVLKVEIPSNAQGEVGILNEGWWGMDVSPQDYATSFYVKPSASGNKATKITASIRSAGSTTVFASVNITLTTSSSTSAYTQFKATLSPTTKAPNAKNTFALTFDAKEVAGQTFYFSLVSLFPPTYKNKKNGLRKDLAQTLKDLHPKFLRFPGGNTLEGLSFETRWQLKKKIGDLKDRSGRVGNWGYHNSDGLGYLEYLEILCEDLEPEPLLTVYAEYSLDASRKQPAHTVPKADMGPYIQEAIDQLEYAMRDAITTTWGKKRAEHDHPAPFRIKYVEIGNEDVFSVSYPWRFPMFLNALKKAYPSIIYISSQATENSPSNQNIKIPPDSMWDLHHYKTPQFYKDRFNFFNWKKVAGYPDVTIFVGEFSMLSRDRADGVVWANGQGRFTYPTMVAAIGEAIFALAMEHNPNVVKLSSYAPLFQNFNFYQWTLCPDLIGFTAIPEETVLSTSYYQIQLFAKYRGIATLPIINTVGKINPLRWAASINQTSAGKKIYIKIVNASKDTVPLTIELDADVRAGNATYLSHNDEYGFN
ncbi:glycoside hydrolase superfamily [Peziza echinospora]|nr:glycoside hydrolase superfamily [Peziza echinospora]